MADGLNFYNEDKKLLMNVRYEGRSYCELRIYDNYLGNRKEND